MRPTALAPSDFIGWMRERQLNNEEAALALDVSVTSIKMWRSGGTQLRRFQVLALRGYDAELGAQPYEPLVAALIADGFEPPREQLPLPEPGADPELAEPASIAKARGKLSPDDVRAIRRRFEAGERASDLAVIYGVQPAAIRRVARRIIHGDVPDIDEGEAA